jgi:hypothetical protein
LFLFCSGWNGDLPELRTGKKGDGKGNGNGGPGGGISKAEFKSRWSKTFPAQDVVCQKHEAKIGFNLKEIIEGKQQLDRNRIK